jgi:starvation-inducible DNA-binding protein
MVNNMDELKTALKILLANNFVMYFKTHSYHWNIEGIEFSQYHDFFGDLYEEVFGALDKSAEELRSLDEYAPMSLVELYDFKTIQEDATRPILLVDMLTNLQVANDAMVDSLNKVFELASAVNEQGVADFAAGRLDVHKKHGWMIRSSLKRIG